MTLQETTQRIFDKMLELRKLRSYPEYTGVKKVTWNPKMTEEEVLLFEERNGIRLPEEYRFFITHVCNGGSYVGFLPLSPTFQDPDLKKAFPLEQAWEPSPEHSEDEEEDYDFPLPGTLYLVQGNLANGGFLVLTGEKRGMVWWDGVSVDQGIKPISSNFLTFLEKHVDYEITSSRENIEKSKNYQKKLLLDAELKPDDWYVYSSLCKSVNLDQAQKEKFEEKLIQLSNIGVSNSTNLLAFSEKQKRNIGISKAQDTLFFFRKQKQNLEGLQKTLDRVLLIADPDPALCIEIALSFARLGNRGSAYRWLEKTRTHPWLVQNQPTLEQLDLMKRTRWNILQVYIELEDYSTAQIFLKTDPYAPDPESFSYFLLMNNQYHHLVNLYPNFQPAFPLLLFYQGRAYEALRDFSPATLAFRLALEQKALEQKMDEDSLLRIKQNLALCLCKENKILESLSVLDTIQKIDETTLLIRGLCYQSLGQITKAIEWFTAAYHVNYSLVAYGNIAYALIMEKEYTKAEQMLIEMLQCDPNYSWTYYRLAILHACRQDIPAALSSIKKAYQHGFSSVILESHPCLAPIITMPEYRKMKEQEKTHAVRLGSLYYRVQELEWVP